MKNPALIILVAAILSVQCVGVAQAKGVTVYTDCNFTGKSATFEQGKYRLAALLEKGLTNDSISSIKVDRGLQITIYKHDKFSGKSLTFTRNASCLRGVGLENDTSSIRVEREKPRDVVRPNNTGDGAENYNRRSIAFDGGRYEKTSNLIWTELDLDGRTLGTYEQLSRRGNRLFLYDARREELIDIDQRAGTVRVGPFGQQNPVKHRMGSGGGFGNGYGGPSGFGGQNNDYIETGVTGQNVSKLWVRLKGSREQNAFVQQGRNSTRWNIQDGSGRNTETCVEMNRDFSAIKFDCEDTSRPIIFDLLGKTVTFEGASRQEPVARIIRKYRTR